MYSWKFRWYLQSICHFLNSLYDWVWPDVARVSFPAIPNLTSPLVGETRRNTLSLVGTQAAYTSDPHSSFESSRQLSFIPGSPLFYLWWLGLTSIQWSKLHRSLANRAKSCIFSHTVPRAGPSQYSRDNCCCRRTQLVPVIRPTLS